MKGITQNMHDGWFWPGRVRWGSRIRVMNLKGSFAPTRLTWWNSLGGDISSLLVSSAFKWQCGIDCPGLNWSTCFFITYGDIVLSYYQYMYTHLNTVGWNIGVIFHPPLTSAPSLGISSVILSSSNSTKWFTPRIASLEEYSSLTRCAAYIYI